MSAEWNGPLFLVGCSRSGTTLLQQMLNAHSGIAIAPETHFMERYWGRAGNYGNLSEDSNFDRLLKDIVSGADFPDFGVKQDLFLECARTIPRTFPAVLDLLMELFARTKAALVRGEKTPGHIHHMSYLANAFPEARFVHMVRDPRAVVNSRRNLPWVKCSLADNARFWVDAIRAAKRQASPLGDRLITVRYEDLVSRPEMELRGLCHFLGLDFEPETLEYWRHNRHLVNLEREPWKERALQPLEPETANRWRCELTSAEIREIEAVAWPLMRQFGYFAESPALQLLPRVLYRVTKEATTGTRRFMRRMVQRG